MPLYPDLPVLDTPSRPGLSSWTMEVGKVAWTVGGAMSLRPAIETANMKESLENAAAAGPVAEANNIRPAGAGQLW